MGYRNRQMGLLVVGVLGALLLIIAALFLNGGLLAASGRDEAVVATRAAARMTEEARPASQVATPAATPAGILTRAAATPAGMAVFEPIPGGVAAGSGYIVEVAPPFAGNEYHIVNEWYRDVADGRRRIFVFAGSVAGPGGEMTEQGVVIVQMWEMGASEGASEGAAEGVSGVETVESNSYLTGAAAGALRIVGAEGERLRLETADGRVFYFDVNTRELVE